MYCNSDVHHELGHLSSPQAVQFHCLITSMPPYTKTMQRHPMLGLDLVPTPTTIPPCVQNRNILAQLGTAALGHPHRFPTDVPPASVAYLTQQIRSIVEGLCNEMAVKMATGASVPLDLQVLGSEPSLLHPPSAPQPAHALLHGLTPTSPCHPSKGVSRP